MKRFIYKSSFFTLPFLLLYSISYFYYSDKENPDLLRLGCIPNIYKNYRMVFNKLDHEYFIEFSKSKKNKFEIMTIGDSFSELGADGYKNFLAKEFSVLHIDRFISNNQIQTLINFCNSDFFDNHSFKYIVLQNVERHFIDNITNIDTNKQYSTHELDSIISNHKNPIKDYNYKFFSRKTLEFPLYHLPKYFLSNNYVANGLVYNVTLNSNSFFSTHSNKLFFYCDDLEKIEQNNQIDNLIKLNDLLNFISTQLKKKNLKLIVLPTPDKFDFYYEYITDKAKYKKPLFFDKFKNLNKDYIYIDSKEILSGKLNTTKDIYLYDDTHWSPIAAKIIAENIIEKIKTYNEYIPIKH